MAYTLAGWFIPQSLGWLVKHLQYLRLCTSPKEKPRRSGVLILFIRSYRAQYVAALKVDVIVAATIRAMLDDGEIDRATAELAWLAIVEQKFLGNLWENEKGVSRKLLTP